MSKTTFIDGNKTILETDYYLKLLGCESKNKELKKQLNASRRVAKYHLNRELDLEFRQKEFINYLEKEIVDCKAGSGQQFYYLNILKFYKEIMGVEDDN